jgi:putative spermidine/putrescine transport system permease protein
VNLRREGKGSRNGMWLSLPGIGLVVFLGGLPLLRVLQLSFTGGSSTFRELGTSDVFLQTLTNTLELAATVTVICLVIAYPLAYWLSAQPRKVSSRYLLFMLLPFWISVLVRVYAWQTILGRQGLVNRVLMGVGVIKQPLDLLYTSWAVVLAMAHYLLPYMILALYSVCSGIDWRLMKAATSLGASRSYAARRVFLPLSVPGAVAGSMLVFVLALGFFIIPALLGSPSDMTIAVYIQRQTEFLRFDIASGASVVLVAASLTLFFLLDRVGGIQRTFAGQEADPHASE